MSFLGKKQKHLERSKLPSEEKDRIDAAKSSADGTINAGLNGSAMIEPVPAYDVAECETVLSGQNNSWIVLGRDRPYSKASGYGGSGGTQCGMIDLVVGRRPLDSKTITNPNFISDAARIYISQRTDIDNNMQLASGRVGQSISRSAIGMKADDIRIVARRGIKIVTGVDRKNSRDERNRTILGIDLIAGNDDGESGVLSSVLSEPKLQPLLLGHNTRNAMFDTVGAITELGSIVNWMMVHMCTAFGILAAVPGAASASMFAIGNPGIVQPGSGPPGLVPLMGSYKIFNQNCQRIKTNYLLEGPSADYICSRHNRTT
jgi:hypothetical protein